MAAQLFDERLPPRFWDKVSVRPGSDCWIWTAYINRSGYGRFRHPGFRTKQSHRIAYQALVAPMPDNLHTDHLCRVRACCNPAHLEPVTPLVNCHRGEPARRTSCPLGHAYDEDNTILWTDGARRRRKCLACRDIKNAKKNAVISESSRQRRAREALYFSLIEAGRI